MGGSVAGSVCDSVVGSVTIAVAISLTPASVFVVVISMVDRIGIVVDS